MFITSFEEQNITYRSCSNLRIHLSLPLNNAPAFTQLWSMIIPFTPYAKLQTEQWVIGSDVIISVIPFIILLVFAVIFSLLSLRLLKKNVQEIHS